LPFTAPPPPLNFISIYLSLNNSISQLTVSRLSRQCGILNISQLTVSRLPIQCGILKKSQSYWPPRPVMEMCQIFTFASVGNRTGGRRAYSWSPHRLSYLQYSENIKITLIRSYVSTACNNTAGMQFCCEISTLLIS
jgi:hypothetical protein